MLLSQKVTWQIVGCMSGQRQSGGALNSDFSSPAITSSVNNTGNPATFASGGLRLHWVLVEPAIEGALQCNVTWRIRIHGSSEAKTLPGVGLRGR